MWDEAERHFSEARLHLSGGDVQGGMASLRWALEKDPGHAPALLSLFELCRKFGHIQEAADLLERLTRLDPQQVPDPLALGATLLRFHQSSAARRALELAVRSRPEDADPLAMLGRACLSEGDVDEALEAFSLASERAPEDVGLRVGSELLLPLLYRGTQELAPWRRRFSAALSRLVADAETSPELIRSLYTVLTRRTNFFLAFQGEDDRSLQQRYGQLLTQVVQERHGVLRPRPHWVRPKVRIGYISSYLNEHTVGRLAYGLVAGHDRERFEVYCYHLGDTTDGLTDAFRRQSTRFFKVPPVLSTLVDQLREDELDIAAFTDLGMEPLSLSLAAAQVAPVQCTFWYHPVTSGLPTIQYFVSSDGMEPVGAEKHYSEELVRLPGIASCYSRPVLPEALSRKELGLPEQGPLLLSPQFLYKYLPQHDSVLARILKDVPDATLVLIAHHASPMLTRRFLLRLSQALAREGLELQRRVVVLPSLTHTRYLQVNMACDLLLDTFAWSGGRTTLEALACGRPVVSLPGALMRGRHTACMLGLLGLDTLIAKDEDDYVRIAVRLARDPAWRSELSSQIQARADGVIYDHPEVVRTLEAHYLRWLGYDE